MNIHYKNKYDNFINNIRNSKNRNLGGYTERHHIVPVCMKGTNDPNNLVVLSLREHFLAHWLLWKTYPTYLPIVSAFLQMNNKNIKTDKPFQGRITSKTYATLKEQSYTLLSNFKKNKVYVKDADGKLLILTREEYKNSSYVYHNTGKIYVKDADGKLLTLTREEYKNSFYVFHTTGKTYVYDTIDDKCVYIDSADYRQLKTRYISYTTYFPIKYQFKDIKTGEVIKITKSDAKQFNLNCGYKQLKQEQQVSVKCYNSDGDVCLVSPEEFKLNSANYTHILKNTLSVFDTQKNQSIKITKDEYNLNPNRYITSTKGKVLAKDEHGNTKLISKKNFTTGNYVGITNGLRTVLNKETNMYVQITEEEFKNNKNKYSGPNIGKVNIINKQTGERKQILKTEFNTTIHVSLGNTKLLFLCRNKLTNKEKLINIYEWEFVKNQYDIINLTAFNTANTIKEKQ